MSTQNDAMNEPLDDHCDRCSADTPHRVEIEIIEEDEEGRSPHSREPYRVRECQQCGEIEKERMNGGGFGRGESR